MIKNFGLFLLFLAVFFILIPLPVLGFPISVKSEGNLLYVAHHDGALEIWDKSSGSLVKRFLTNVSLESFETDGTNLYVGSGDGELFVFDSVGRISREINASPDSPITALAVDNYSQFLYTGSLNHDIRVWNMNDWSLVKLIEDHKLYVTSFALDDRYLYSASLDGSVRVWDKQTLAFVKNLTTHTDWQAVKEEGYAIWEMVMYGNKVYTGHTNGKIRIWDLTTDSLIREIRATPGNVKGLATDEQYIYSASFFDKSVRIWTIEGEPVEPVLFLENLPRELEVDDSYLYVGVTEGGVMVYNKDDWRLAKKLGNFTEPITKELQSPPLFNPVLVVVYTLALFLVIALMLETYAHFKKRHHKLTTRGIRNFLSSFVTIDDFLKILIMSSVIIFVIGLLNTRSVFPSYVYGLQAIYYFDVLVRRGALLPLWFLLFPSVAYWMTKKYNRRTRYLALFISLLIAIIVYLIAPTVLWVI